MTSFNQFMKSKFKGWLIFLSIVFIPILTKAQHTITAANDNANAGAGGGTVIAVVANDFYFNPNGNNGDLLYVLSTSNPTHGTISPISPLQATVSYTPNASFTCGYDSFFYVLSDTATPTLVDTAWVYITIDTPPSVPRPLSISSPLCAGNTISYSCTPGTNTPHWSGPNSFATTNASGTIANAVLADSGYYHVYVSDATNCFSKDTVLKVSIYPAPTKPIATLLDSTVCIGKNTTLNFTPISVGTIAWTGPNFYTSSNQSNVLGPIASSYAGDYIITLTLGTCIAKDTVSLQTISCPVPNSGFTTNHDTICSGATITFTDTSGNNPNSWVYTFNTGGNINVTSNPNNSILQNPTITFSNTAGTIQTVQVSLQAVNANGNGALFTHNVFVRPPKPVAAFTPSTVTVCQNSTVNFNDNSSNSPDAWSWNFGSGTPSTTTAQNPTNITYNNLGQTTVTLTASNFCGSNSKSVNLNVITVPTPSFSFTTSNPVCNNNPVVFTDASLNATSWNWDFGDSHTSTLQNPVDSYATAGKYYITLTATNICGTSAIYTDSITVKNCSKPVSYFTVFTDTVCMNTSVQFADSSSNGPNVLNWIFQGATPGASNDSFPIVSFNSEGNYIVTLVAQNFYGADTFTRVIVVQRCLPPVANFFGSTQVCEGQCANFTNTTTEFPDSVIWHFGTNASYDTTTQYTPVSPCYKIVGIFPVKLTACNKYGCDSITGFIKVLPSPHIYTLDTCITAGYTVKLLAHGNGLITWMPNISLDVDLGDTVKSTPVNKITYTVHDTTFCPSPDSITICLDYSNTDLKISNTFTPDGNGRNDVFKIKSNIPLLEFNMKIYNRWGVLVFQSSDYNVGWDGLFNNTAQNSGVFVYIVSYRDLGSNEYKTIKGNVTLIK
jgi:gliding motility-associated-like protein